MAATSRDDEAEWLYSQLMAGAAGTGNDQVVACIYASWSSGAGAMPDWLGLTPVGFKRLMAHHFPGARLGATPNPGRALPVARRDEVEDLVRLMWQHRAEDSLTVRWMAELVAAGCLGSDHLWQDLGLWSRADLTALMRRNFPSLAALNTKDMKWKRFLYRQLCETEGIRLCRSPSCEECCDYHVCFGPED
ncbi:NifQ [Thioflavicoccus mobilis 8321]|uniref:NifQ n=1 Tax=Thioflavicoccus mobilis 8321 TaxID=765912 RepID=L0H144_9GAMM|nr:nitrogen fixation protein NifQ [Thioflavicoccus mobilis]AGA91931.1 NifQ [Thioflavicoccus mobilis 8321]